MIKISGLDALAKQLDDAQQAMGELEGELSVSFDPNDPASIEAAIQDVEGIIDAKILPWASNALVGQMVAGVKGQYRQAILDRAAAARLEASEE